MEDLEDVTLMDSSLPEDSFKNTSTQNEPLPSNDIYDAELIDVGSTIEQSVIFIDEEETLEAFPSYEDTPLNLSTSTLPITIPFSSNVPESSSTSHANNDDDDDDDFCIVYEKKVSPAEVQILENYSSPNVPPRKKHRIPQNSTPSNQSDNPNSGATEQTNPSLDDSILIVEDEVEVPQSENQSSYLNRLQQLATEALEKKKRKIECSVCFDGPDEIEESGKNLVSTVCGHIFCSSCIKQAITSSKRCPQCRKKLTMKQFHVLFV